MQLRKSQSELTVLEAVDNLSQMAELDVSAQRGTRVVLTEEQIAEQMATATWHDREYEAFNRERIKDTFQAILKYLQEIYDKDKGHLRDEEMQRALQALMGLVTEAVQKIDQYTQIFKTENVKDLKEYKELQHFYQTKVLQRFQTASEAEEFWQEEWGPGEGIGIKADAINDLEAVRQDRHYELFQIKNEEGKPYFSRPLVRHMQLLSQFDVLLADSSMDDPFLRIRILQDREAHFAAKQVLNTASSYIDEFFKDALKFKRVGIVTTLTKAMMALMMAGNPRNLMQAATGKSAFHYYADFCDYLRQALQSAEYRKFIAKSSDLSERFLHTAGHLAHVLSNAFFLKASAHKEMLSLIHLLIDKGSRGSVILSQTASPMTVWNHLRDQDSSIRLLFRQYPSGPLLKTVKLLNSGEVLQGFDPLAEGNSPSLMYAITSKELHISCIRLPCPTAQQMIHKAEGAAEFKAFLRTLKNQRHLLINLQDRTSWQEYARCSALEGLQKDSEFADCVMVVSMPKNTDFYLQAGGYIEWDDAVEFTKQLKEQVRSGEQCGFFFPKDLDQEQLLTFADKAIEAIHSVFFGAKERLVHKNRLDFIEIFYLVLTLKVVEEFKPDSLSFTCKDAVDTGPAASAELFAFLRMMNDASHWSKGEVELLLWMLYTPALLIRERAIDMLRFNRMASALAVIGAAIEAHPHEAKEHFSALFKTSFFSGVKVSMGG